MLGKKSKKKIRLYPKSSFLLLKKAKRLLIQFFIPNQGNNYHAHSVRHKTLAFVGIITITLKISLTATLFFLYPSVAEFSQITSQSMFNLTNQAREENDLTKLKPSSELDLAARMHANDMIANNYFDHTSPFGKKFTNWIIQANYYYQVVGENLAIDFRDAESIQQALMDSPAHQENILNQEFDEIGLAVIEGKINNKKTTVLVEMFGKRTDVAFGSKLVPISEGATYFIPASMVQAIPYQSESSFVTWVSRLLNTADNVFWFFLIFILVSLLLNTFIKIKIQNKATIIHGIIIIFITAAALLIKLHFLESIPAGVIIM